MADSYFSFHDARQQLENEMTDRQRRLISILTGQSEGLAAERELLENEIEERNFALEKLEAQSCCNCCGTQVYVPEMFRVRIMKYSAKLPLMNVVMEKIHVRPECADCSSNYDSHLDELGRIIATKYEVGIEIGKLQSSLQWQDLKNYADRHALRFPANLGQAGDDLFHEALLRTLDGRRKWNLAAVDIFGHLLFAMKGIANGWGEDKFYGWKSPLEAVTHNAEGDEVYLVESLASTKPLADRCFSGEVEVERLFGKFREDKVATAILQAKNEGLTTAREIMQEHNLTKRQYTAGRRRIHAQQSILIIEEDDHVLALMVRWLKSMDFAAVTASTTGEGLRIYRECGPFAAVMMSYSLDLNGVELAMNICKRSPSQNMIFTTTYSSEEDVVRPSELADLPILLKPFLKAELRAVLDSFANSVKEQPASRCREKRRRGTTERKRRLLQTVSASRLPKTR